MDKRQILSDWMGANLPLVYGLAHKAAKRLNYLRNDPDTVNELANEIVALTLTSAANWDPNRCSPCTYVCWQGRAALSRASYQRAKKAALLRVAAGENEIRELANTRAPGDHTEAVDHADTIQAIQNAIQEVFPTLPPRQARTIRAVVLGGKTRRQLAKSNGTSKSAVEQKVNNGLKRLARSKVFRNLAEVLA